ncbi:hypothetical protein [Winogradskyella sp.]|uniref:hypothetical protein n=1 Tax=Winogradskyella sp. TaxID=1883156 RepID=UPI003F6B0A42
MNIYKPRHIKFKELITIKTWKVKIYTIVKQNEFYHPEFYENVKKALPNWLKLKNCFNDQHNHIGFLILHAGTEGIFSLVNWWVDNYMLNTNIYFTE